MNNLAYNTEFKSVLNKHRELILKWMKFTNDSTFPYVKCMKELDRWGYIRYSPSANRHSGSEVSCIRFDTGSYTGSDTGNNTGDHTGSDTLFKRVNNTKDKQDSPENSDYGERKKDHRSNSYNVNNDKNYLEP